MSSPPFCVPATPTAAAEAALRAFEAGDWPRFIALVHPDALDEFRRAALNNRRTEEFILEHADAFPGFGGPEFLALRRSFVREVLGVESWDEAERMPASDLYARYLGGGHAAPRDPDGTDGEPRRAVLGAVDDGPDVAHVVFRQVVEEPVDLPEKWEMAIEKRRLARVLTVKRTADGTWRVMLNGGLFFDESGGYSMGYRGGAGDDAEG